MEREDNKPSINESITWPSLIPELFYDLIGRVIPGWLFIIGLVYALDKTIIDSLLLNESKLDASGPVLKFDPPYTFIFILLLIVSYASGLILSPLGHSLGQIFYIRRQYRKKLEEFKEMANWIWKLSVFQYTPPTSWEHNDENGKKIRPQKNDSTENSVYWHATSNKKCDILFQRQHDYVKQEYAHQARVMSKLAAEVQLCIITSAAYIVLCPILTIRLLYENEFSQRWVLVIVYAAIALFSFIAAWYRNERFLMRQFSFSAEIKKREKNPETPKNKKCNRCIIVRVKKFTPPSASS